MNNTKRALAAVALAGATLTMTGPAHADPTPSLAASHITHTSEEGYKIQRIGRLLVSLTEYMQQNHVLTLR